MENQKDNEMNVTWKGLGFGFFCRSARLLVRTNVATFKDGPPQLSCFVHP